MRTVEPAGSVERGYGPGRARPWGDIPEHDRSSMGARTSETRSLDVGDGELMP
jgi:hypothetical protein